MEYSQPANLERVRVWVTGCNHHPIGEPSSTLSQIDQLMIATLSGMVYGISSSQTNHRPGSTTANFFNKIHHPTFAAIRITTPCPRPIGGVYCRVYFFCPSRASNSQIDVRLLDFFRSLFFDAFFPSHKFREPIISINTS